MPAQRYHLQSIDFLRGLAAVYVTLYHAHGFFWRAQPTGSYGTWTDGAATLSELTFGQGWLGVPLFFVLSGFCIHLPYVREAKLDVRTYAIRRLVRLWIPLAACVPLGLALTYLHTRDAGESVRIALFHLVFWIWDLDPLGSGERTMYGFTPVWTVVVEVQLYALYVLFWPVLKRIGLRRLTIIFLVIGCLYHLAGEMARQRGVVVPNILQPRTLAIARFGEWLLGAWVAESLVLSRLRPLNRAGALGVAAAGVALVAAGVIVARTLGFDRYTLEPVYSLGFAAVVLGAVLAEQAAAESRWLRAGGIAGKRCYSLYLFHFACLAIVGEIGARIIGVQDKTALGGDPRWLLATLAALATIAVVTEFVYRFIELPSHRLARRLANAQVPLANG